MKDVLVSTDTVTVVHSDYANMVLECRNGIYTLHGKMNGKIEFVDHHFDSVFEMFQEMRKARSGRGNR